MTSMKMKARVAALSVAALAGFAPVAFSSEQGLTTSEAVCDTCCPQEGATCVIGDVRHPSSWHKATPGSCNDTAPAPPPGG
jgi:hypothetical protein